jgi:hypothetical protein
VPEGNEKSAKTIDCNYMNFAVTLVHALIFFQRRKRRAKHIDARLGLINLNFFFILDAISPEMFGEEEKNVSIKCDSNC